MEAWCLEHPFLTFFIVMSVLSAIGKFSLVRITYRDKDKR